MKRPFVSMAAVALLSAACVLTPLASAAEETTAYIDNSALIPKIVDDSQVVMEDSGNGLMSPDWVKTLIIGEITIARCTPEGTSKRRSRCWITTRRWASTACGSPLSSTPAKAPAATTATSAPTP